MRNIWKQGAAWCLTGTLLLVLLAGCGTDSASAEGTGVSEKGDMEIGQGTEENGEKDLRQAKVSKEEAEYRREEVEGDGRISVTAILGEGQEKTIAYETEDLENQWDETSAGKIVLGEEEIDTEGSGLLVSGNEVLIQKGGTYVVSGKMEDGQIRIEAEKGELVQLVLNGVELSNKTTAPLYGAGKAKVVLTLAEGTTNVFQDGSEYLYENQEEDEPDAPIFINGDLTINGLGELQVYGNYQSGIRSKDKLKVMSGTIRIEAEDDGLKGRDCVVVRDGILDIQAVKDGIKSNQDTDPEKGFIWIDGGVLAIRAKDDGIQAETALIVCGGQIEVIESQEGLAGKTVDILGGSIKAKTQDDGINSAASVETEQEKMQDQQGVYIRIAGGEVWLDAQADGIDSNGDLYMEGGTLYLSGPTSRGDGILDYNGTAQITGGTVFAAGTSGMMQTFGEQSSQNYVVVYWEESQEAGSTIRLLGEEGGVLAEYAPEKAFDTVIISVPGMETGSKYRVRVGEEENGDMEIEITGIETVCGNAGENRGRNGGHGGRRLPEGEEPPEGFEGQGRRGMPEGGEPPEGFEGRGRRGMPEGGEPPEGFGGQGRREMPEGGEPPEGFGGQGGREMSEYGEPPKGGGEGQGGRGKQPVVE